MSARPSDKLVLAIVDIVPRLIDELGERPFTSAREAASTLAELLPWGHETIRRALRDPRLGAEVEQLVEARPTARPTKRPTPRPSDPPNEKPQLDGPPAGAADDVTPHISTSHSQTPADPGPSQHPHPTEFYVGRRPREVRRSSFPGRCVVCCEELPLGFAYYLTPYDTGTVTACHAHAPLALAGAQLAYDVQRGRPVAEELELYVRPRPTG